MEDLNPGIDALAPTSQHAGNQLWDNRAMTAPGGDSGDAENFSVHAAPSIDVTGHQRRTVVHGEAS